MSATIQPQTDEQQSVQPQTDKPQSVQLQTNKPQSVQPQTDKPSSDVSFKFLATVAFFGIAGLKLYFDITGWLVDYFYPIIPETPETPEMRRAKKQMIEAVSNIDIDGFSFKNCDAVLGKQVSLRAKDLMIEAAKEITPEYLE